MKSQNNLFKVISTFSGCGGSSLGYKLAGGEILLAVEMNKNAVDTYKINFPKTKIYHGDIHNLSVDTIFKITGIKKYELDIFDGSPPCQGFSLSGKRDVCDPRNQLYNEYVRLLKGLMPKVFVMENVTGLVKGKNKVIFKDILLQLKSLGYDVKVRVMNSQWYNVPQKRERVIFIGVREDLNIPASHPKPQSKPVSVKNALKDVEPDFIKKASPSIMKYIRKVKPGHNVSTVHPKKSFFNYHLLDINKPSPTIMNNGLGNFIFPGSYRILTPGEAKLLSSFPKDFKLVGGHNDKFARVGNAVPPNLMKAIANHIKENILEKI